MMDVYGKCLHLLPSNLSGVCVLVMCNCTSVSKKESHFKSNKGPLCNHMTGNTVVGVDRTASSLIKVKCNAEISNWSFLHL